jgi:hypothetical protein
MYIIEDTIQEKTEGVFQDVKVYWLYVPGAGEWGQPTAEKPAARYKTEFAASVEAQLLGVGGWAKLVKVAD